MHNVYNNQSHMKHTNWDSCSVSSSRPASASAGLQEYNCMNIKQGSAGIRAWTSAEKTLIHADSELIPTWGTSVHVCDTADIMPPVPYSLDMLTCSWEHLSSDSVWSYVTCTSGACIRPRPSRVYRTHSRGALQCRPMISLHVHCLWLYMQRAGGSRRISELRWTNMFSLLCTTVQFEQIKFIIPPWLHSLRLHPTWWCSTQISSSSDAVMVVNLPVETIPRYTVQHVYIIHSFKLSSWTVCMRFALLGADSPLMHDLNPPSGEPIDRPVSRFISHASFKMQEHVGLISLEKSQHAIKCVPTFEIRLFCVWNVL